MSAATGLPPSPAALPPTPGTTSEADAVLFTLSGRDRPGVSKALFGELSKLALVVLDVEQIVIRDHLILAALVAPAVPSASELLMTAAATAERVAVELGLQVAVSRGGRSATAAVGERVHVTLLGAPLVPSALFAIAAQIASSGGNIDRIERLAAYPVTALEMDVSGADAHALRNALTTTAITSGVDVAVQRSGLHRRAKQLVVLDVDSTLIQGEVIEMLAAHAGCEEQVAAITARAMSGTLDFETALRERVALLAGLDSTALDRVSEQVALSPGARTLIRTLKRLGFKCAIVSGGFRQITERLAVELSIDYFTSNTLEIVDGTITGRLLGPVVDRAEKAAALRRFAAMAGVTMAQTVAIGDGANDLDMLSDAGLGIAFNAKPVVRAAADTSVSVPYLDSILFLLGISREEIESADAGDIE